MLIVLEKRDDGILVNHSYTKEEFIKTDLPFRVGDILDFDDTPLGFKMVDMFEAAIDLSILNKLKDEDEELYFQELRNLMLNLKFIGGEKLEAFLKVREQAEQINR